MGKRRTAPAAPETPTPPEILDYIRMLARRVAREDHERDLARATGE